MNDAGERARDDDDRASNPQRWLRPDDAFFRAVLALPELALVAESCAAERRLHDRLEAAPTCAISSADLAGIADDDARANYATFLAFRDAVVAAGTLESYYLALVRAGRIAVPAVFIDHVVAAIVSRLVADDVVVERRAAQLLHRPQRVAIVDGRVLCADREHADRASDAPRDFDLVRDLVRGGGDDVSSLPIIGAGTASDLAAGADLHGFVLDLTHQVVNDLGHGLALTMTRAGSGMAALARVLERWVAHFLAVETTIRPVPRIDDPAWRWHVGLDAESSALLDALYRGETPDADRLERLVGLFRLEFADAREMRADVAGKPVHLGLAIDAERVLKLKPQNLLVNLPLAASA